ncbi:MAG: hypothetical protein VW270_18645 [Candidatus Poseidoniales archaeon]|jgi:hypothetical protein
MSESNFWALLRNKLKLRMYRVENRVMKGMPDVHYIREGKSGWIELKYLKAWPKNRVSTGLKLNQCLWLKEYNEHKGDCWILLRVGRDYTGLIHGREAKKIFDRPSSGQILDLMTWGKRGNMTDEDWQELADVIAG